MKDSVEEPNPAPSESEELEEFDSEESEGAIHLPPGANCRDCEYSALVQVPGQIKRVRICKRFPPTPMLIPVQNNKGQTAVTMTAQHALVADGDFCYEFDPRENPEVIPTALG